MRKILLALFLVGCGGSISDGETTWDVTLGNWETPTCEGSMRLAPTTSLDTNVEKLIGNWNCGVFRGQANAQIHPDGRVFLDLESNPGNFNGVRAAFEGDDAIVGNITFDDRIQPFAAYRQ
ncbi:MAG: hypothetical protein EHM89_09680 [Acidobacteria bacterium]|nr:MAG: hypothetical protein EHM89_09680 [Acidobacteriota bacterium]